ncbi:hypothetical protein BASA50_002085 [Batrachochytrium salamandrivorans]|uniref:ethanolamine-phosphate cytidylyltransferase n=1 Tax=Batrachochytrium salamandrivorans TaxID=1357716 RepID=A0ABQ8FQ62_9FUNG|nr:hypothetical protein BASA62_009516 [Batrachochytrium salamandrivorans]KAH6580947.1 hypothetical protein BASA60_002693 [Batrachochytrium salamandrivorans]KAH6585859.1 hypothetical protein BASA61_006696 [Batrachochytrium salamandrivorans]KAH6600701.1 hypothetical protein BASA50_002085 [Batrachochytrium salamandrivorans]
MTGRPVRIWVDGCFDGMHYGHANALRQAKMMGDYLVVGVHSDEEIERNKGPTVIKENERYAAVAACKWVDEVVPNAPYLTMVDYLDKYNCDFCVHGDDVTTMADGSDCYHAVKAAGRYKECKRTEGISTTDLVERMLFLKANPLLPESSLDYMRPQAFAVHDTEEKLRIFSNNRKPQPDDRVVYVAGSFDMFHTGHIEFLKNARNQGTFVIAGIYSDRTVSHTKRAKYPIMNLHERALSVLACRYVDDIIMDVDVSVSAEFLNDHRIDIVCHPSLTSTQAGDKDMYKVAKELGKFKEVENPLPNATTDEIVGRILDSHLQYEERNRRKAAKTALESYLGK